MGKLTNQNAHVSKHGYMHDDTLYRLVQANVFLEDLYERDLKEASRYISPVHQDALYKLVATLPYLDLEISYQPITRTILKVSLTISAEFIWSDRWNGMQEPFWIFVNDDTEILHQEFF